MRKVGSKSLLQGLLMQMLKYGIAGELINMTTVRKRTTCAKPYRAGMHKSSSRWFRWQKAYDQHQYDGSHQWAGAYDRQGYDGCRSYEEY